LMGGCENPKLPSEGSKRTTAHRIATNLPPQSQRASRSAWWCTASRDRSPLANHEPFGGGAAHRAAIVPHRCVCRHPDCDARRILRYPVGAGAHVHPSRVPVVTVRGHRGPGAGAGVVAGATVQRLAGSQPRRPAAVAPVSVGLPPVHASGCRQQGTTGGWQRAAACSATPAAPRPTRPPGASHRVGAARIVGSHACGGAVALHTPGRHAGERRPRGSHGMQGDQPIYPPPPPLPFPLPSHPALVVGRLGWCGCPSCAAS
jgi:hypothetical protein